MLFSDTLFHALAVVSDRHIHGNRLTVRHILVVGHTLHIQSHIVVEVAILLISSILVQLNCQTKKRFLEKGCSLIGESLISLGRKLTSKVLICAVQRDDTVIIPSGSFVIQEGDRIHFTADTKKLGDFLREVNLVKSPFKNIMIVGGGRIGFYLADTLSAKKYNVKLIEKNEAREDELAETLPRATVLCGNGTQFVGRRRH